MNFALMQHHNYKLDDLEYMLPFERDILVHLVLQFLEEEKNRHAK